MKSNATAPTPTHMQTNNISRSGLKQVHATFVFSENAVQRRRGLISCVCVCVCELVGVFCSGRNFIWQFGAKHLKADWQICEYVCCYIFYLRREPHTHKRRGHKVRNEGILLISLVKMNNQRQWHEPKHAKQ